MIEKLAFPDDNGLKPGAWYPVYFRANFDTPERLVVGVVARIGDDWHLQEANALERLRCLYSNDAHVAIDVIQDGLASLRNRLPSLNDSTTKTLTVSGLSIGEQREGHARNPEDLAIRWLRLVSSLHNPRRERVHSEEIAGYAPVGSELTISRDIARDRLPVLVMEKMSERFPQARRMFNQHVHRLEKNESARLLTHKAYIAYDGQRVAANFSTLKAGRNKPSVDVAKRLMWDLEQHRDQPNGLYGQQKHAMYLYYPSKDDPTITERQFENVMEVVETLTNEGSNRQIEVVSRDSVAEISTELLAADGLA